MKTNFMNMTDAHKQYSDYVNDLGLKDANEMFSNGPKMASEILARGWTIGELARANKKYKDAVYELSIIMDISETEFESILDEQYEYQQLNNT